MATEKITEETILILNLMVLCIVIYLFIVEYIENYITLQVRKLALDFAFLYKSYHKQIKRLSNFYKRQLQTEDFCVAAIYVLEKYYLTLDNRDDDLENNFPETLELIANVDLYSEVEKEILSLYNKKTTSVDTNINI